MIRGPHSQMKTLEKNPDILKNDSSSILQKDEFWMNALRSDLSSPLLLCGSPQGNVCLKGWNIPNLNVFKKGEFLFLNECNAVGPFLALLPLLCGSSQCFPPLETSTYVSGKDSSLDTSGKMRFKLFLDLFTTAPRLNRMRLILHFWAKKKRRRRRHKAAKSCLPLSFTFLCTRAACKLTSENQSLQTVHSNG